MPETYIFSNTPTYMFQRLISCSARLRFISIQIRQHTDLDVPVKQYILVDEDFELAPGIEVVNLPGHTPGLIGLIVHLEKNGTIILPQDCVYTQEVYGPPAKASGLLYDSIEFFKSIEKLRKLQKKYNAKIVFAHDYEFFKTLKTVPEYYE